MHRLPEFIIKCNKKKGIMKVKIYHKWQPVEAAAVFPYKGYEISCSSRGSGETAVFQDRESNEVLWSGPGTLQGVLDAKAWIDEEEIRAQIRNLKEYRKTLLEDPDSRDEKGLNLCGLSTAAGQEYDGVSADIAELEAELLCH